MNRLEEEKLNESGVSTPPSTVADIPEFDTIEKVPDSSHDADVEKSDATPPVRNIHGWQVSKFTMILLTDSGH